VVKDGMSGNSSGMKMQSPVKNGYGQYGKDHITENKLSVLKGSMARQNKYNGNSDISSTLPDIRESR